MPEPSPPPVVTISASYGSGGSWIGPRIAERLGVPFLDRAIPAAVSDRLSVSVDEALAHEELPRTTLQTLFAQFAPAMQMIAGAPAPVAGMPWEDANFQSATEEVLRERAQSGAVLLGRAAAIVLRDQPHVLHVRLDGPPERRVVQAMRLEHIDRKEAERGMRNADVSREAYVRHCYRVDPRDPSLYDLVIDSTRIPLEAGVELITLAESFRR